MSSLARELQTIRNTPLLSNSGETYGNLWRASSYDILRECVALYDKVDRLVRENSGMLNTLEGEQDRHADTRRERDEARAEVRALCGEPEALDPYLPEGWERHRGAWVRRHKGGMAIAKRSGAWNVDEGSFEGWGKAPGLLAAMHAADKALEDKSND